MIIPFVLILLLSIGVAESDPYSRISRRAYGAVKSAVSFLGETETATKFDNKVKAVGRISDELASTRRLDSVDDLNMIEDAADLGKTKEASDIPDASDINAVKPPVNSESTTSNFVSFNFSHKLLVYPQTVLKWTLQKSCLR